MCAVSFAKQECVKRKIDRKQKLEKSVKRKENEKHAKERIGKQRKREPRN